MTALVTGGTGLIGNAIASALVARGDAVRALVRDEARARTLLPPEVSLVRGDITDPASLIAACRDVDVLYHAAGLPEQWFRDKSIFDRVNRQGTANVCEAAHAAGVRRVVYTSTMDVFREDPADGMLRETMLDPNDKHSVYERSKQAAEREVQRFLNRGLDVVFTNPGSVYGPSPTQTGMNEFFARMLAGKAPMLPPGGASLAFVDSVADAHLAAATKGTTGERYLLADAFVTMRELGEITVRVAGLKKTPGLAPAWLLKSVAGVSEVIGKLGVKPMIARDSLGFLLWEAKVDSSKAQRELGYKVVPIEDGVRRTVEHLRTS